MWAFTTRNLWAHKRRLVSTVFAVALGVAFLAGTLLLSDTLRANFSKLFTQANGSTSVVIRSTTLLSRARARLPRLVSVLMDPEALENTERLPSRQDLLSLCCSSISACGRSPHPWSSLRSRRQ